MARLLRSTSQSIIRKPVVVGPAVTFRPIKCQLAPTIRLGRAAHSKLSPPIVVGVTVTFTAPALSINWVPSARQGRATHWRLQQPAVVGASITFRPVSVYRARPSRPPKTQALVRPPTFLGAVAAAFIAPALKLWKVAARKPAKTQSEVRAPAVVDPSITFRAVQVFRTRSSRPPKTQARLQPPMTLAAIAAFIAPPLRV